MLRKRFTKSASAKLGASVTVSDRTRASLNPGPATAAPFGQFDSAENFVREWLFDPEQYRRRAALPASTTDDLVWNHYWHDGRHAGQTPSPWIDLDFCKAVDLSRGIEPTDVYQRWNSRDRRLVLNPLFDPTYYLLRNDDVRLSGLDPLCHWLMYGIFEGRSPAPFLELHALGDVTAPDAARASQLREVSSLESFFLHHSSRSSLNMLALRQAYGDQITLRDIYDGFVYFPTEPQILFGPVARALIDDPDVILELTEKSS